MISTLGKTGQGTGQARLCIHETKQENRDSDNDLFLFHCEGKKFDEWGLFNFRCCLKSIPSIQSKMMGCYIISPSEMF